MINRPAYARTRPIVSSQFTEEAVIVRINRTGTRNKYGEPTTAETDKVPIKCSTNPISMDDERLGDLQKSGVRLTGLREFFTTQPMSVEFKDEFSWPTAGGQETSDSKRYVAVQTADWGYFQATIAALKEDQ